MIKEITVYECEDGKRFDSAEDAKKYGMLLNECKVINNMLGVGKEPKFQECAVQLDKQTVDFCYEKFIGLCEETFMTVRSNDKSFGNIERHFIHRLIDDYVSEYPCFGWLSQRFHNISTSSYIEYDQPYFTKHESEFKGKVIKSITKKLSIMEKLKFEVKINLDYKFDDRNERDCIIKELQEIIEEWLEGYVKNEVTGLDSDSSVIVEIK